MDDEQVAAKIERRDRVRVVQTIPPFIDAAGKEVGPREVVVFSGSAAAWRRSGFYGRALPNTKVTVVTRERGTHAKRVGDDGVSRPNQRTPESPSPAA